MALSDCIKCWSTPCECGYEYRDWSWKRIFKLHETIVETKIKYIEEQNKAKDNEN